MQSQIHKVCKMKEDREEKQKKWKEKFGFYILPTYIYIEF
jgi:hypothetical protein